MFALEIVQPSVDRRSASAVAARASAGALTRQRAA
jgi:hypothetical protein